MRQNWIKHIIGDVTLKSRDGKSVRTFATVLAIILMGLSVLLYFKHNSIELPIGLTALSLFTYFSKCTPYMRVLYVVWVCISKFIGTIVSTTLLIVVYVLIVIPIGLIKRTFSKKESSPAWTKVEESKVEFDKLY